MVLTNNVTVGEAAFYCPLRAVNSADVGPYVISASGNNEITGTIATDSTPDAINKYYTIQSNSGSNLKISGNIVADKTGESFLTLRGAGTGEVSGGLLQPVSDFFSGAARTGNVMSIIKEDSGTWKFTGTMENTGTTTVNKGTLLVNTTHTGGGLYTVNNGGTLGGTGTIDAPVSVANGGKLSPGASIGTFTVNNSVTMLGGSSLATEIAGMTNDQLVVGGNLDLSDTSLAKILDVYRTGTGSSWVIATYAGVLTGVFEKVSLGYTVNYGTGTNSQITLTATNAAGDYNNDGKVNASDYVLWRNFDGTPGGYFTWRSAFGIPPVAGSGAGIDGSAVPEPAALGLLLGAVLCAIGYRRR